MPAPSVALLLRIVIDANVLAYAALSRLLLALAAKERLISPFWSAQILEEAKRTIAVKLKHGEAYAAARLAEFTVGFPEALQADLEPLIAQCTNDAKDRHVLAAAIKAQARIIVTFNQKHFSPEHLEKWEVRAVHPEDFLLELYAQNPAQVWRQLGLAADTKHMELAEFVSGYSSQLARFKDKLLADL